MGSPRKVLLVYPEVPKHTYWSFEHALRFVRKKSAMPPLGLITIAAYFPENYQLRLVDMNIEALKDADVFWADQVYVSAMIVQKNSFEKVVATCNRMKTKVIAGGAYPTSSHAEISAVDHLVLGEVENTLPDIIRAIENGEAGRVFPAVDKPSLTRTRTPRFDLLKMENYASMSIQYSRGCPFRCEFCDIWSVYGNKPRLKTAPKMISELDTLYELGWRGAVFIVDDNFIGNKKRVKKELLPALAKWQRSHDSVFRFFTEASINMADDNELMTGMREAGFDKVFIGLETPSLAGLKETGKNQNLRVNMLDAVKTIQCHGIEVMAGFIVGFDSDAEDIFDRQIDFIQKAGIPQAMVGMLTALPGTQLHQRLKTEGRLLRTTDGNNTHGHAVNFKTRMDAKMLKDGYNRIMSTIYDRALKNYFKRCSRLLDRVGNPQFSRKIHLEEVQGFIRSLLFQTTTLYGYQYIKFLMRSLIRNRQVFSEAVRLSVIGHHFYKITREMNEMEKISTYLDEKYVYLCERINACSAVARENYAVQRREIGRLIRQKQRILNRIQAKIDRLHVDFRRDIALKYAVISDKLQIRFEPLENKFSTSHHDYL